MVPQTKEIRTKLTLPNSVKPSVVVVLAELCALHTKMI